MPQPPPVPTLDPKQPTESRLYTFDFSEFPEIKNAGETITGAGTASATPSGLTLGAPAIASGNKKVNVRISSGTDGTTYKVTLTGVGTSGSNILEMEFNLPVKDL